jgi:hypothetical protein
VGRPVGAFRVCKPNIGNAPGQWLDDLRDNYRKISEAEAKPLWDFWWLFSLTSCSHGAKCSARAAGYGP